MIVEIRRAKRGEPVEEYITDLDYWEEEYEKWEGATDTAVLVEADYIVEVLDDLDYGKHVVSEPNDYDLDVEWIVTVYDYYME